MSRKIKKEVSLEIPSIGLLDEVRLVVERLIERYPDIFSSGYKFFSDEEPYKKFLREYKNNKIGVQYAELGFG
jgi:hypothetical protein